MTLRKLAIVEDDTDIARLIVKALQGHRFAVEHFACGGDFLRRLAGWTPDACVVDLGLPDMDGLELVRKLGDRGIATVVLSGRGDLSDRVLGLELGADDYLVKPFEPRELVARINSILRRAARSNDRNNDRAGDGGGERGGAGGGTVAAFAGWSFDPGALTLTSPTGETVRLSRAEAELLELFVRAPNRVLSRDFLMEARGNASQVFDRSIDVRISRLRQKLEDDPQNPRFIRTIYGSGYLFAAAVEWRRAAP